MFDNKRDAGKQKPEATRWIGERDVVLHLCGFTGGKLTVYGEGKLVGYGERCEGCWMLLKPYRRQERDVV